MAVVLLVRPSKEEGIEFDVPVAPMSTFRELWLPACEVLGLKWVPQFETGIPVSVEDVPDVLEELRALKAWLDQPGNATAPIIGERVEMLMDGLEKASKNPHAYITIG